MKTLFLEQDLEQDLTKEITDSFISYNEDTLTTEERNKLKDEDFALPEERKFPIHDATHVRDAITYFRYIPEAKRKEAAKRIKKAADKFGVKISKTALISKYLDEDSSDKDKKDDKKKVKNEGFSPLFL